MRIQFLDHLLLLLKYKYLSQTYTNYCHGYVLIEIIYHHLNHSFEAHHNRMLMKCRMICSHLATKHIYLIFKMIAYNRLIPFLEYLRTDTLREIRHRPNLNPIAGEEIRVGTDQYGLD